ncbi:MAG: gfo/Idh/MocA family oxidoreductase [Microbacteriaceae bacterium]|nr:MAG: gfo/Idh/MocA family oxidoreductase [Microbacteriaceae bacterium]
MSTVGVGIVGTGMMARIHAAVVADYHRSTLAGWSSRTAESAARLDDPLGAPVYLGLDALLAAPDVDAVIVATPDHLHADAAVAAAEAGKHILVEKPLATTSADARRIRDAARASGVIATTLFNQRWVPGVWEARQLTKGGAQGKPQFAYARKNDTINVPTEMIAWASDTTPSFILSGHDLDIILWCLEDRVVEVYATAVHGVLTGRGIDTPDAILAQLRLEGGGVVTLETCWTLPNSFPSVCDSFIQLFYERAVLRLDRLSDQLEVADADGYRYPGTMLVNSVGGRPNGSVAAAIKDFVDAVADDREPLIDIDDSVHVTDVLAAIDASWRSGVAVRVVAEED